jgi:uncharacterized damage-inducible protein DinB
MKEQLASLYEYSSWVNQRLLDTASTLTNEQFTQKILPTFDSVHLTLVHLLGAEVLWFARAQSQSPKTMLTARELSSIQTIREHWGALIAQRRAYVIGLDEAELDVTAHWTNMRGQAYALPRWQVLLHSANHSTHHRSEVAALLTALGYQPDSTDLLEFYLEHSGQPWKPTGHA